MITDVTMGNMFSSNTPLLSSIEGTLGTYKRVYCMGMKDLLMVQTGFADKRAEAAGADTP